MSNQWYVLWHHLEARKSWRGVHITLQSADLIAAQEQLSQIRDAGAQARHLRDGQTHIGDSCLRCCCSSVVECNTSPGRSAGRRHCQRISRKQDCQPCRVYGSHLSPGQAALVQHERLQPVGRQPSSRRLRGRRQRQARAAEVDLPQRRQLPHDAQRWVPAADERAGDVQLGQRQRRCCQLAIRTLTR